MVERAADAMVDAWIIPDSCRLIDYVDQLTAKDAADLGVYLTEKTENGEPRFHWLDYIRENEWRDTLMAIARPLALAALTAALKPSEK